MTAAEALVIATARDLVRSIRNRRLRSRTVGDLELDRLVERVADLYEEEATIAEDDHIRQLAREEAEKVAADGFTSWRIVHGRAGGQKVRGGKRKV